MSFQTPKKRCRTASPPSSQFGATPETPQPKRKQVGNGQFLTAFDEANPIAIVVTPLRKSQGAILRRNLQGAGANVLSSPCDVGAGAKAGMLVVVTDNREKARQRLNEALQRDGRQVQFVSTKWASAVLSSRKYIPLDSYLLTDKSSEALSGKAEMGMSCVSYESKKVRHEHRALPVWCSWSLAGCSDIEQKQEFVNALPSLQCERATLTQAIYAAPNRRLCTLLEQMAQKRELEQSGSMDRDAQMRARAYRRASAALKCVPFAICTADDVATLSGLGPRVLSAAREYVRTGTICEAGHLETNKRLRALATLTTVYGVGVQTAQHFHDDLGITDIAMLCRRAASQPELFQTPVVSYLKHVPHLQRADRATALAFRNAVDAAANNAADTLDVRVELCGGFRRGEPEGHDVDLIFCRHGAQRSVTHSIMKQLEARLIERRMLAEVLWESCDKAGGSEPRFGGERAIGQYAFAHDVVHAVGEWGARRFRVDLVGVRDAREMAFAMLAWSGSTAFQRDLRLAAEQRGWAFNQHGFFERIRGYRVQLSPQPGCEMDVFDALGLPYRAPFERSS